MPYGLRSTDEDAHVAALIELLEGGVEHDGFEEAEEELDVVDLNDLGEDDLDGRAICDEAGPLPRQVSDDELDVRAHN